MGAERLLLKDGFCGLYLLDSVILADQNWADRYCPLFGASWAAFRALFLQFTT
jgi:hypothetical protein